MPKLLFTLNLLPRASKLGVQTDYLFFHTDQHPVFLNWVLFRQNSFPLSKKDFSVQQHSCEIFPKVTARNVFAMLSKTLFTRFDRSRADTCYSDAWLFLILLLPWPMTQLTICTQTGRQPPTQWGLALQSQFNIHYVNGENHIAMT